MYCQQTWVRIRFFFILIGGIQIKNKYIHNYEPTHSTFSVRPNTVRLLFWQRRGGFSFRPTQRSFVIEDALWCHRVPGASPLPRYITARLGGANQRTDTETKQACGPQTNKQTNMVKITFHTVSSQKPEKETDGDHIVIPHVSWRVRPSLFGVCSSCVCLVAPLALLQPRSSSQFSAEMVRFVMHRRDK